MAFDGGVAAPASPRRRPGTTTRQVPWRLRPCEAQGRATSSAALCEPHPQTAVVSAHHAGRTAAWAQVLQRCQRYQRCCSMLLPRRLRHAAAAAARTAARAPTRTRASYPGHLPTNPLQKIVAAGAAAALALADPARADMVGLLGEATGRVALERIRARLRSTDEGREILKARPIVTATEADAAALRRDCAAGTFGRASALRRPSVQGESRARDVCGRRRRRVAAPSGRGAAVVATRSARDADGSLRRLVRDPKRERPPRPRPKARKAAAPPRPPRRRSPTDRGAASAAATRIGRVHDKPHAGTASSWASTASTRTTGRRCSSSTTRS